MYAKLNKTNTTLWKSNIKAIKYFLKKPVSFAKFLVPLSQYTWMLKNIEAVSRALNNQFYFVFSASLAGFEL